ncbi:hypothetical protein GCM10025771_16540 [Niveibacterium umoris]|uniref:DedD protein n=1 Tax=Niveibacterium umoris TaxID=1193620 RepID=A0A840BUK3_9RHOO|nr:SPOR domain-containing protein [Niveibacterium umoris]MBB4014476.1 DedD protein [Niveibacterium umoris]
MAEARPAATAPEKDERRQLLIRGGVAAAVIGVLLVALLVWERAPDESAEPQPTGKSAAVPTPQQIRAASGEAAPAAQSAGLPVAESSPPVAQSEPTPMPAASEPAVAVDVAEETRGVTTEAPAEVPPARKAAPSSSASAEGTGGRVRLQAGEHIAGAPRLVVQAEPAPAGAKPPAGRAFALQAGVFSSAKNAEDLRARLELAGIPAQVESRVVVGPFKSRQDAEQAQNKLKTLGIARGQLVTVKQP